MDDLIQNSRTARQVRESADNYLLVLVLLVLFIFLSAFSTDGPWLRMLQGAMLALATLVSFRSAHVKPRAYAFVVVLTLVWLVDVFSGFTMSSWLSYLSLAALLFVTPVVILRRISSHRRVTVRTIAGAMCVYLQIGIAFALLYRVLLIVNPDAITSARPIDALSYLYMSFITLTTVGYGDVTPVTNPARVAAMFEALLGQVFLVVIVARLVSVYGQDRPPTEEELAELTALGQGRYMDAESLPPTAPNPGHHSG